MSAVSAEGTTCAETAQDTAAFHSRAILPPVAAAAARRQARRFNFSTGTIEGRRRNGGRLLGKRKPRQGGFTEAPGRVRTGSAGSSRERFRSQSPAQSSRTDAATEVSAVRASTQSADLFFGDSTRRFQTLAAAEVGAFHLLVCPQCPGVVVQNNPAGLEDIAIMRNL